MYLGKTIEPGCLVPCWFQLVEQLLGNVVLIEQAPEKAGEIESKEEWETT